MWGRIPSVPDAPVRSPVVGLLGALQFLTRIPIHTSRAPVLARSVVWFPVVGALIGAFVGGVAAGLGELTAPSVAAAVALVVGMLVTGAFHEDGLADLADAVAGGTTLERRLEILKDPRHGTYGVAALAGSVLVRWSALAALAAAGPRTVFVGAIAAHVLGRAIAVAVMAFGPSSPTAGLGADWMRDVGPATGVMGLTVGIIATAVAAGWWTPAVIGVAAILAVALVTVARRAFGGISGDALGAVEQVTEAAVLVALTTVIT